jgi:hypothetical protein
MTAVKRYSFWSVSAHRRARIVGRNELAILMVVERRAFEIERRNARELRKRMRVDRELREWLVGGGIGLTVEDKVGAA